MSATEVDPDRAARAARAILEGRAHVERLADGRYRVESFTGTHSYRVSTGPPPSCTCPDAAYRGATCKHILAARLRETEGQV